MKYMYFFILFILCFQLTAENPDILEIRYFYNNLSELINNQELYEKQASVTYYVIPGIGTPHSILKEYYNMIYNEDINEYEIYPLKIINTYQYAGNVSYEEYVYNYERELIFVFTKCGFGNITEPEHTEWLLEERYYYKDNEIIRIKVNSSILTVINSENETRGNNFLKHGYMFLDNNTFTFIPEPLIFSYYFMK
jgi:hypothetical protein